MDALGTIEIYETSRMIDRKKKKSMENYDSEVRTAYMKNYNDNYIRAYRHGGITINPKWGLCYGGR